MERLRRESAHCFRSKCLVANNNLINSILSFWQNVCRFFYDENTAIPNVGPIYPKADGLYIVLFTC